MNYKEKLLKSHEKDDESQNKTGLQSDIRLPFDMKSFWRSVDEKYFQRIDELNIHDSRHLVQLYSKYDLNNDHVYAKIGFPHSLSSFLGKSSELFTKKNNPHFLAKLFGMYVYIDEYDYTVNNVNSDEIQDEITAIEGKLSDIETSNIHLFRDLHEKINNEKRSRLDVRNDKSMQLRFENITNQIYSLQMKQFAESISNIKKDIKKNNYILIFDVSENIDTLTLNEADYKELLKFRDPMNSISVYDLFQEKIHSYYNTSPSKGHSKKACKGKGLKKKRGRIPKKLEEDIQIARVILIDYDFCHHCKQRKPAEVMVRCNSGNCSKFVERPMKTFYVNNTTVLRKFKNFIITNYVGDPKDFLDGYLNKKIQNTCKRFFCHFCLKGSYDQVVEQIKDKKDWICPWCLGTCFCSRCARYDQILKLISLYISIGGDINILYDDLITRCSIFDNLSVSLIISNVIILKNDQFAKSSKAIKTTVAGKRDSKEIEKIIDYSYKYRDQILEFKDYFDQVFCKARIEKALLYFDKKLTDICLQNYENLLNRKKKRDEKSHELIKNHLDGREADITKEEEESSEDEAGQDEDEDEDEDADVESGNEEKDDGEDSQSVGEEEDENDNSQSLEQSSDLSNERIVVPFKRKRGRPRKYQNGVPLNQIKARKT